MASTYAYINGDWSITIHWTDGEFDYISEFIADGIDYAVSEYAELVSGTNPVLDGWEVCSVHDPDIEFAGQLVATDDPAYFATHNDGANEWWQRSTPDSRLGRDFLALLDNVDF